MRYFGARCACACKQNTNGGYLHSPIVIVVSIPIYGSFSFQTTILPRERAMYVASFGNKQHAALQRQVRGRINILHKGEE